MEVVSPVLYYAPAGFSPQPSCESKHVFLWRKKNEKQKKTTETQHPTSCRPRERTVYVVSNHTAPGDILTPHQPLPCAFLPFTRKQALGNTSFILKKRQKRKRVKMRILGSQFLPAEQTAKDFLFLVSRVEHEKVRGKERHTLNV